VFFVRQWFQGGIASTILIRLGRRPTDGGEGPGACPSLVVPDPSCRVPEPAVQRRLSNRSRLSLRMAAQRTRRRRRRRQYGAARSQLAAATTRPSFLLLVLLVTLLVALFLSSPVRGFQPPAPPLHRVIKGGESRLVEAARPRSITAAIRRPWERIRVVSPPSASMQLWMMSQEASNGSIDQKKKEQPLLMLYNSLTRTKQPLEPLHPPRFAMYTCGPTVYDSAHIGNFRAFLTYDVLKRVLLYLGYDVEHVCNLTDIDDKIIQRANQLKAPSIRDITDKYAELFLEDLRALNVVPATHYPRATNHVQDMADMIRGLHDKGLAYETSDGSWYFDTQQQPSYGTQLVQLNFDEMMKDGGAEDDDVDAEKKHFADFCLWKAFKEGIDRGDAAWSFPPHLQKGRPGWHLECSAMVHHYFGSETIDLHGGGVDLKFPHHENEIAQSQGYTDNPYCNCWFHNGFVNIDNEKMSKSLGNFKTLRGACPTPLAIRAYRYLVVSSQYRNPLSFTDQAMQASQNAVTRIDKVRAQIQQALLESNRLGTTNGEASQASEVDSTPSSVVVAKAMRQFEDAIRDDLAMPRASAALFALVKDAERIFKEAAAANGADVTSLADADAATLRDINDAMNRMDMVFGIFYAPPSRSDDEASGDDEAESGTPIPEQVLVLVSERAQAKADKDWALADSLRTRIAELGYQVKDVKDGDPIVSRAR
jgi:cysteinyl-tRNA synthetase